MIWTIAWVGVSAILFACLVVCAKNVTYQRWLIECLNTRHDCQKTSSAILRDDLSKCIATLVEFRNFGDSELDLVKKLATISRQTLNELSIHVECEMCHGAKDVDCHNPNCYGGNMRDGSLCPRCDGTGLEPCNECNGEGEC